MRRRTKERLFFLLFRGCALVVALALLIIVGNIVLLGIGTISWEFLTQFPKRNFTDGGIFPAIVGTLYLMTLVMLIAVPIGVFTAVYISEYQGKSRFANWLRVAVNNLAGVPSIVYGLLGLGMLVLFFGWGFSLIASAVTLAFLVLPLVITASREAIQAVPSSLREASLALGTTKWQTIRHHVLPYSLPGILTGVILSLSRAAGETAPILLTGVVLTKSILPQDIWDTFMAMPFQLYALATQTVFEKTQDFQYGTALVLLVMVVLMNLVAIIIRNKYREKYKW
ncbi:MAG: phosphate ABC transporter permease PstA [Methanomassiliicoccales archaeon]|nr:phosphate ABC transporter permease PstA [Methanomassiliicoccales archaeon]MDD1757030.1 phosphate ABC transporter permease PstA [Methanomassiliicoccales archaeon]